MVFNVWTLRVAALPVVVPVSIGAKEKVAAEGAARFSLKFAAKTGLFTGSFEDNGGARPFEGAVLQSGSSGLGLFQDAAGQTGSVLFEENP